MQTKGLLLLAAAQYVAAYGQNAWMPRQEQGEIVSQNWKNYTNTTTTSSTTTTTSSTTTTTTTSSTSSTTSTTTLTTLLTTTSDETTTTKDSSTTTDLIVPTTNTTTSSVHSTNSTTTPSSTTTTTSSVRSTTPSTTTTSSIPAGVSFTKLNATDFSIPLSTGGLLPSSIANSTASRNRTTTTTTPAVLPTSGSLLNSTTSALNSSTATNTTSSTATKCGVAGSFVTPPSHATKADSIDECATACRARGALCRAFEAGTVDGDGNNCWLFAHSLSDMEIGGPQDGFSWTFYDRDCDVTSRCNLQGSFITKPIESLRLGTLGDCQQACLKNSGCKTFEAGDLDGNEHNCWLFDSPITSLNIGGAYTGWQWAFFDRNCELAP
ncbi:hypothetical protein LMH87_011645 [Akanthomyces muscarius]|uniref:Apple domain-containing protein n=1 Tax=Akanthomyces muscarius TaxID=2231603 RepID=A0A9W8UIM6_AKAMU|nr:hypothetical protein LMH87_011645 [Akanthomyces muscarius]KAJ4150918.1 hypothetical protein LMH87_011645 [Akanthomyces muscarius]